MNEQRNKQQSLRSMTPALIFAAVAVLIFIVISVIAYLPQDKSPNATVKPINKEAEDVSDKDCDECCNIIDKAAPVIPLSLKNTYLIRKDLYWLHLDIDNQCDRTLHLKVYMEPLQEDIDPKVTSDKVVYEESLYKGRQYNFKIDVGFKFLDTTSFENARPLRMRWVVEDRLRQKKCRTGTIEYAVLPRNEVYWDLATPDGPVPKELLVASLSAWILKPSERIKQKVETIKSEVEEHLDATSYALKWFERCYLQLTQARPQPMIIPANIVSAWKQLPPSGQQRIRSPAQLLNKGGRTDPLETALLFASLAHASELCGRRALFAFNDVRSNESNKTKFLIGWSAGCQKWRAINLNETIEKSFSDNEAKSSALLNTFISRYPNILTRLDDRGVFIEKDVPVIALDFTIAHKKYLIQGLP
jgi:hypothetical protein